MDCPQIKKIPGKSHDVPSKNENIRPFRNCLLIHFERITTNPTFVSSAHNSEDFNVKGIVVAVEE